jgi:hypothetical protein
MKKIALVVFAALLVIACNKDGFEITGLAEGVENGKKVYLETQTDLGPVSLDTAVVENGKFKFEGKLKEGIELAFVRIETLNGSVPMILENGDISVEFNKDTIPTSL